MSDRRVRPPFLCVPNISEGRRRSVVAASAEAMQAEGVRLLDVSCDATHHRAVVTVAGEGPALERALRALFTHAIAAIDLRQHAGVHPRIGAVDVVPIVPLGETPMAAAADLARTIAGDVAGRFQVPVYLYEEAARSASRRRLEDIRRGGFEGLAEKMRDPAWAPDFGPARPHPSAGASAIGARRPLVAFNVHLATDRVDIAKAVARAVREQSGGLPFVKALGVAGGPGRGAQVTMNLTSVDVTPLEVVFARVRDEAGRRGVAVEGSEVVGLLPAAALPAGGPAALMLRDFDENSLLEARLDGQDFDTSALFRG